MVAYNDNSGVPNLPYFTPQHVVSPGTPIPGKNETVPTLFKPLTIRGVTLRNRIIVARKTQFPKPEQNTELTLAMCQYSTAPTGPLKGALTDYHIATLGHYALKGAALVFVEATGVQPNGRISPNCPGLWTDAQIPTLKRVSDFVKSQGALSGLQLAHAGRKSSTAAPWTAMRAPGRKISVRATEDVGGWPADVVGPMGGEEWTWDGKPSTDESGGFWAPRALSEGEIQQLVRDWASAAARAVKAGIDVLEVHAAHGYLIHQFLSPVTNQRTDRYGGSFENRTRLLVEIVRAIRGAVPVSMPLFVRVSSTEWMEETDLGRERGTWDVDSTIRLAKVLSGLGVDLLDVSSGGNNPQQRIQMYDRTNYQTKIAHKIRTEMKREGLQLLIGAVGLITEAEQARDLVEEGGAVRLDGGEEIEKEAQAAVKMTEAWDAKEPMADVVLVARQFMREPEWVLKVAWKLGLDIAWPNQFLRVRFPKL